MTHSSFSSLVPGHRFVDFRPWQARGFHAWGLRALPGRHVGARLDLWWVYRRLRGEASA